MKKPITINFHFQNLIGKVEVTTCPCCEGAPSKEHLEKQIEQAQDLTSKMIGQLLKTLAESEALAGHQNKGQQ